ncbi:MAG: hypothetical protein LC732_05180, partial [Acidobacteria bacterium]|nr:hypothetical protein [Acidobacteriota bacterium]
PPYSWYGARFNSAGERLDPDDLPLPVIHGVAPSSDGFLLFGYDTVYRLRESSSSAELLPAARAAFSSSACAGEICLDATLARVSPSEVRVTRRRGAEVLDPQGVVVATGWSDGVSVASDGRGFLVAGSRRIGEGTIQTFARVSVDGDVVSVGDFAAAPRALTPPLLVWTGEHYVAIWKDGIELRTMRITSEGAVLDGDSTGWEGIRTGVGAADVWRVEGAEGAGTILVESPGRGGEYVIASDGSLMPAGSLPRAACEERGACLRVFNAEVTGDPWFKADRLFLQTESRSFRRRPARRP